MLKGKHIILGVTGSIAAYKSAVLCRLLVSAGAEVKVVMTNLAKQFITPLTMATVSKNPILVDFFNPENGEWNSHVKLGEWADLYLIAPASANTMAKMAAGVADNLLLTTYLSARCPVAVAPAMDLDMYAHVATQRNMEQLKQDGVHIIEPGSGFLASGLIGKGRMAEPQDIVEAVEAIFASETTNHQKKKSLEGKRFLVTAGATIEPIDPVRFISNHSSGKMGYAVAESLAKRGAEVVLVSGRTALEKPQGVECVDVLSAEEMFEACVERFSKMDGAVMCAAVADYTPQVVAQDKIKKNDDDMSIALKRTRDIAAHLGQHKREGQVLVGFAMETENEEQNATGKLAKKNLDFIVMNSLRKEGAGFRGDTNIVSLIDSHEKVDLPLMSKADVAERIVDKIESFL
ncbi:MAG: bifunctional phosphopantothenoylcysteine decarboxylase/phosphopantothenate--cysteine ligase CoaBC [Alistipes sp.]|nr:bifunctional phosphopantothenoylcysteine decarboxylase/phosphopantothenate--cysteine ligase CoaBC [Alistipes sp.]